MNLIILMGRLTKDAETRYTQGSEPMAISNYTLAVDRPKNKNGETVTDFINCTAFGKNAEFAEKYLKKGTKILVRGSLNIDSYTNKDGNKAYSTKVIVEHHEFCESKGTGNTTAPAPQADADGFTPAPIDEDLPFAPVTR